jgi:hypothetical protein
MPLAASSAMRCPKCQFDHALQTTECLKCGIVFTRYQAALDAAAQQAAVAVPVAPALIEAGPMIEADSPSPSEALDVRRAASKELTYRAFALPVALLVARGVVSTGLRLPVSMLTMVLHESGHAITAWLTGRWAVPLPWVTMHGQSRGRLIVVLVTAAILFAGLASFELRIWGWRWTWACITGVLLLAQLIILCSPMQEALVVFGGDGGALVLAALLMAAFYAPRESALHKNWGLRWGLLIIGALAFMLTFRTWSGPVEDMPFGEIEGVNLSDPSLLTDMYGWSVKQVADRYIDLATFCLVALFAVYVWGLLSAYAETRVATPPARPLRVSVQ